MITTKTWPMNPKITAEVLRVFAVASTNVCENILSGIEYPPQNSRRATRQKSSYRLGPPRTTWECDYERERLLPAPLRRPSYFTLAAPPRTFCLEALGAATAGVLGAPDLGALETLADGCLRPSMKLLKKTRIGLAM